MAKLTAGALYECSESIAVLDLLTSFANVSRVGHGEFIETLLISPTDVWRCDHDYAGPAPGAEPDCRDGPE